MLPWFIDQRFRNQLPIFAYLGNQTEDCLILLCRPDLFLSPQLRKSSITMQTLIFVPIGHHASNYSPLFGILFIESYQLVILLAGPSLHLALLRVAVFILNFNLVVTFRFRLFAISLFFYTLHSKINYSHIGQTFTYSIHENTQGTDPINRTYFSSFARKLRGPPVSFSQVIGVAAFECCWDLRTCHHRLPHRNPPCPPCQSLPYCWILRHLPFPFLE